MFFQKTTSLADLTKVGTFLWKEIDGISKKIARFNAKANIFMENNWESEKNFIVRNEKGKFS